MGEGAMGERGARGERAALQARWLGRFRRGAGADGWGQVEEAEEEYDRLWGDITGELRGGGAGAGAGEGAGAGAEGGAGGAGFSGAEREALENVAAALILRITELRNGEDLGLGAQAVRQLEPLLSRVLVRPADEPVGEFPLQLTQNLRSVVKQQYQLSMGNAAPGEGTVESLDVRPGDRLLRVTVDRVDFKASQSFIEPVVTIRLVDKKGNTIEPEHSTSEAANKSGNSIHFGSSVNIQTPLNEMESGCAIVFELRHYKPLRKKQSVRVWSFMDLEEFRDKEGAIALEIYAKPADYLRRPRSLRLFSRKPLYFHVTLHHRQF